MMWNADLETDDGYYVCYARWDPLMRNWTMVKKLSPQNVDSNSYLDLAVNGSGICYATWNSEGSIYLRKTTSDIPDSFELDSDADSPDLDKNFELQWGGQIMRTIMKFIMIQQQSQIPEMQTF